MKITAGIKEIGRRDFIKLGSTAAIWKVLNTPSKSEKVFPGSKISPSPFLRNRLYGEIFDTFPAVKKESIQSC